MHGSPEPHAFPQLPQSSGLVASATHFPLHSVVDAGHSHAPFWQLWPDAHAVAQPPQCNGSADVSTQLWPHVEKGVVQLVTHAPD